MGEEVQRSFFWIVFVILAVAGLSSYVQNKGTGEVVRTSGVITFGDADQDYRDKTGTMLSLLGIDGQYIAYLLGFLGDLSKNNPCTDCNKDYEIKITGGVCGFGSTPEGAQMDCEKEIRNAILQMSDQCLKDLTPSGCLNTQEVSFGLCPLGGVVSIGLYKSCVPDIKLLCHVRPQKPEKCPIPEVSLA